MIAAIAVSLVLGALSGSAQYPARPPQQHPARLVPVSAHQTQTPAPQRNGVARSAVERAPAEAELTTVVRTYCRTCHNDRTRSGNLSFEGFDVASAAQT